jgi:glycogen operon protein
MHRFFRLLIHFRRDHPTIHRARFFDGRRNERGLADVSWHGVELDNPGWNDGGARVLGMTLAGSGSEPDIHVMANMYWEALPMAIPGAAGRVWHRVIDTSLASPDDICEPGMGPAVNDPNYHVEPRSVVVLVSR